MKRLLLALTAAVSCTSDPGTDDSANTSQDEGATTEGSATEGAAGELGCAANIEHDPSDDPADGATEPVMQRWGASCTTDSECVELLGSGAVCLTDAVIYELPGGYCSKPCSLPDTETTFVADDPACDPAGGVACVGQKPLFEQCAAVCTDDMQCNRDGYTCRQMPTVAQPGDPSICLMPDCCQGTCSDD